MRKTLGCHVLLAALASTVLLPDARPAWAGGDARVPVSCLALTIDGVAVDRAPQDPGLAAAFGPVLRALRSHGFRVLTSSDPARLPGASAVGLTAIGQLEVVTEAPPFVFNMALLPPQWSRTKTGSVTLRDARTGATLWKRNLSIHLDTPSEVRRQRTMERLQIELASLRPRTPLVLDPATPFGAVLILNDTAVTDASFAEAALRLARNPGFRDAQTLLTLALDHRTATVREARPELLRRAVAVGSSSLAATLGLSLARALAGPTADPALVESLTETFQALGIPAGDAIAPALRSERTADLQTLLAARARFEFRSEAPWLRARIEQLAVEAVDRTPDFARAEEVIRGLPLDELGDETRALLRSALAARVPDDSREAYRTRIVRLLPGADPLSEGDAEADRTAVVEARALAGASAEARLGFFQSYLRCSALGAASDAVAKALHLEPILERELARALAAGGGATDTATEQVAVRAVFGPRPGALSRDLLGNALVASLGTPPKDEALLALATRHPELESITAAVRSRGLVRARDTHTFAVALGDARAAALGSLGSGAHVTTGLTRRDLSPAAFVASDARIAGPSSASCEVAERDGARVLLRDGRVFRIVIEESGSHFHHGVRTGDHRPDLVTQLGEPSRERALLFGRQVLAWEGLHGGKADLLVVMDHGKVSFFYEEDAEIVRAVAAALR